MGKGFGGDKKLKKKKRIRSEEEQMLIMKWKALTRRSLSDASPLKMKQSSYYYYSKFLSNAFGETELESSRNDIDIPTSGISRPLSEILKQLHKKVPDSLVRQRLEDGCSVKYIPWHIVNRIMNLHAPEWSGEVRNITYSPDGKSVSVVYRVTLYGTDAEIYRESSGTASVDHSGYGDAVQKAEAMAFRRACARFGLGLHLYHEDML
ncbi:DNA repair RAD52-like protein 1, mitochondrial isoform X1 [Ricinus communis]|nr:DNA repair RAD52-like protein 1, mitochondrial isoform X1 [Ricinus communis]